MRRKAGTSLALITVIITVVGAFLYHREEAFKKQLAASSDHIVELMDALGADQATFDSAHDRAANSTHTLARMAYNGRLRRGSLELVEEVEQITACREIRDQFDRYKNCLDDAGRINHDAWQELPEVR